MCFVHQVNRFYVNAHPVNRGDKLLKYFILKLKSICLSLYSSNKFCSDEVLKMKVITQIINLNCCKVKNLAP